MQGGRSMADKKTNKVPTYSQQAKKNKLEITPRHLNIDENSVYEFQRTAELDEIFCNLTIYTPTSQSHYGKKFGDYPRLNNSTTNKFLESVFNGLGLKHVYVYETFSERGETKGNKTDLSEAVLQTTDEMLCLRCDSGVKISLYMGVRNAIAHGNIVRQGDYYELYSVSDSLKEYDSHVTFFLRIKELGKLKKFLQSLEAYK